MEREIVIKDSGNTTTAALYIDGENDSSIEFKDDSGFESRSAYVLKCLIEGHKIRETLKQASLETHEKSPDEWTTFVSGGAMWLCIDDKAYEVVLGYAKVGDWVFVDNPKGSRYERGVYKVYNTGLGGCVWFAPDNKGNVEVGHYLVIKEYQGE